MSTHSYTVDRVVRVPVLLLPQGDSRWIDLGIGHDERGRVTFGEVVSGTAGADVSRHPVFVGDMDEITDRIHAEADQRRDRHFTLGLSHDEDVAILVEHRALLDVLTGRERRLRPTGAALECAQRVHALEHPDPAEIDAVDTALSEAGLGTQDQEFIDDRFAAAAVIASTRYRLERTDAAPVVGEYIAREDRGAGPWSSAADGVGIGTDASGRLVIGSVQVPTGRDDLPVFARPDMVDALDSPAGEPILRALAGQADDESEVFIDFGGHSFRAKDLAEAGEQWCASSSAAAHRLRDLVELRFPPHAAITGRQHRLHEDIARAHEGADGDRRVAELEEDLGRLNETMDQWNSHNPKQAARIRRYHAFVDEQVSENLDLARRVDDPSADREALEADIRAARSRVDNVLTSAGVRPRLSLDAAAAHRERLESIKNDPRFDPWQTEDTETEMSI